MLVKSLRPTKSTKVKKYTNYGLLLVIVHKTKCVRIVDIMAKTVEIVTCILKGVRSLFEKKFGQVFKTIADTNC